MAYIGSKMRRGIVAIRQQCDMNASVRFGADTKALSITVIILPE
jgi:hypothetical protein